MKGFYKQTYINFKEESQKRYRVKYIIALHHVGTDGNLSDVRPTMELCVA